MRQFFLCFWQEWKQGDIPRYASSIAYSGIFTMPALSILIITIAGWLVGENFVTQELLDLVTQYAGADVAQLLLRTTENIRFQSDNILITVLGVFFLLFSSLNVIRHLRRALNHIFHSQEALSWKKVFVSNAVALLLLLSMVSILLSSMALNAILFFLEHHLIQVIDLPFTALGIASIGITLIALTILLALTYFYLPNIQHSAVSLIMSAFFTSLLMIFGSWIFTTAVSYFSIGQAYGVAATVLVLLAWIYLLAIIFLMGGEFVVCFTKQRS